MPMVAAANSRRKKTTQLTALWWGSFLLLIKATITALVLFVSFFPLRRVSCRACVCVVCVERV